MSRVDGENVPRVLRVNDMDHVTDIWNRHSQLRRRDPGATCVRVIVHVPLSSLSLFRSVVKATRFRQDQAQTSGMDGQCVLFGCFSHSHT